MSTNTPTISHPTGKTNFTVVDIGGCSVWFSYSTPIAFHSPESGMVVRQNDWSTTTGKHLNAVDGGDRQAKKARVTGLAFETAMAGVFVGGVPAIR